MPYVVRLARAAAKSLAHLNEPIHGQIVTRLKELADSPDNQRLSVQLTGYSARRSRVGGWRIIYEIDHGEHALKVLLIEPRGRAYRNF